MAINTFATAGIDEETTASGALATRRSASSSLQPSIEPGSRGAPPTGDGGLGTAARWGLAVVYLTIAYEWLLSGLDKVFSATFRADFAGLLRGWLAHNPYGWYVSSVERVVLPHPYGIAVAVEVGELLVAAGLIGGALLWVRPAWFPDRLRPWLGVAVAVALLGAAAMELNLYLLQGGGWPWLQPDDPFVPGLSIDGLLGLISLALIPVQLAAARPLSARRTATTGRVATERPEWTGASPNGPAAGNPPSV